MDARFDFGFDYRLTPTFPMCPELPFIMVQVALSLYVGPGFDGSTRWFRKKNNTGNAWEDILGEQKERLQWSWVCKVKKEALSLGISERDFLDYVGISKNTLRGYKKRPLPFYRFANLANCPLHLGHIKGKMPDGV